MDEHALAARIWPGRSLTVEPLGGGITNRNFKVGVDGEAYVLRIGGEDTDLLGIDRRAELEATSIAAGLGVGPEVVRFLEPEGCLVTRFIEGPVLEAEELRTRETAAEVARTLRLVHEGPAFRGRFDSFRVVESYRAIAESRGTSVPPAYADAKRVADHVERARGPQPLRPCHNDLLSANFIHDGDRIRVVDWEYAGMGDVFFDLANFSVNNGLDDEANRVLLEAYAESARDADVVALTLMRFMSDFREAMWGVVQQALSQLEFDFEGYAREHFERLERTASAAQFRAALVAAAGSGRTW